MQIYRTEVAIANELPEVFPLEFRQWLLDNEHIWSGFVEEATKIYQRGFVHYSSRTIIHVLRHHSALSEGTEWKINNNVSPYLSRLFDMSYPQMSGLFEYRRTKAES